MQDPRLTPDGAGHPVEVGVDGDMDLVQVPYGTTEQSTYNRLHLFENTLSGLVDVAPARGMDIPGFGETPTWADFNADGWPDLFVPYYSHIAPFRAFTNVPSK